MSLATLGISLALIWLTIYALNNYFLRRSQTRHSSLLPTPTSTGPRIRNALNVSSVQVTLTNLHLRVQTTIWNTYHGKLASHLGSKQSTRINAFLVRFYYTGSALGLLGMICAIGLLIWTSRDMAKSLFENYFHNSEHNQVPKSALRSVKRTLDEIQNLQNVSTGKQKSILKPIIPGVTVPLSHLPVIVLSVFLSQVIHEAGHALCAALDSIPILSVGLSYIILLPSAFISLSTASVEMLKPASRLRIIAAGPFHNLVFWLILIGGAWAGLGRVWWTIIGYEDIRQLGRIVVQVDKESGLKDHLPSGALVTYLDDVPLAQAGRRGMIDDIWTNYLAGLNPINETMGWCVGTKWWAEKPQTCCFAQDHAADLPPLSCFFPLLLPSELRCLDPVPLLTYADGDKHQRCSLSNPCHPDFSCVHPREREQLLRITLRLANDAEEVLLWSGPKLEILEQVEVGIWRPRFAFLSVMMLPALTQILFDYLQMATLSLYLFNLLPLPFLDGSQLLEAFLELALLSLTPNLAEDSELEALEQGASRSQSRDSSRRWKRSKTRVSNVIRSGTLGLFGICVGLALVNAILVL